MNQQCSMPCVSLWKRMGSYVAATDGLEALKALRQTSVDVVISDLRMPNMSGFELLPNIRCHYPQVGVTVCSAEPEEDLRSLHLPVDSYFRKGGIHAGA